MNINGKHYRTIWLNDDGWSVGIIDQTKLPFVFETVTLRDLDEAARAIKSMQVRGAPLIGATAAYGVALALRADASDEALERACALLAATRPTAVNLKWDLEEDLPHNQATGPHGAKLPAAIAANKASGEPAEVLTHCNAGWLATVDVG